MESLKDPSVVAIIAAIALITALLGWLYVRKRRTDRAEMRRRSIESASSLLEPNGSRREWRLARNLRH